MATSQSASTDHNLLCKPQTALTNLLLMTALMRSCAQSEITELLMTLDIVKASGPDGISAWMSRETAAHISPLLKKNLIYPSSLDHFLHFGKSRTLFQSQKPMTTVIHLTIQAHIFTIYLGQTIGEACSPKHVSTNPQFGNVQWGFQSL